MAQEKRNSNSIEKLASFPSETLNDCKEIVSQIIKRKGETTVPLKDIAIILSKPATNITLPISSCVQYGLLQNVFGSGYKPTDLFTRIETPVFIADQEAAILQALSNAPLYRIIIDEFNGRILPDEQGMTNYLVKNFGIKPYLIQKVVKVFFKNFKEHGLIDGNNRLGVLIGGRPSISVTERVEGQNESKKESTASIPIVKEPSDNKMFEQAIDLGDVDIAYLKYPRSITLDQVELLRIHLEASLAALEARFKKVKKEQ